MSAEELRQLTGVAISGRALLIAGPPGSGKSTLALGLIDRGAVLIGDDGVSLRRAAGVLVAHPPPNIEGLLELRGIGLVRYPVTSAPVALLLDLGAEAPRLPDAPELTELCGVPIPQLGFAIGTPVDAARAEWALRLHGLPAAGHSA